MLTNKIYAIGCWYRLGVLGAAVTPSPNVRVGRENCIKIIVFRVTVFYPFAIIE